MYNGGLFDDTINRIKNVFTNDYSYATEQAVKKYGDNQITRAYVYRTPVSVKSILNLISLGKFMENYEKNYDDVYHLYIIIEMIDKNGKYNYLLQEKRPNINIEVRKGLGSGEKNTESVEVILPKSVLYKDMTDLAKKKLGINFTRYTATHYNCQSYILTLIESMFDLSGRNLKNEMELINFIYQDPKKLFSGIENIGKISNKVTDLGHLVGRLTGASLKNKMTY